jgi:eukaryotic-like serine/threonine-protein kinase
MNVAQSPMTVAPPPVTRMTVMVFTDIIGSTDLKSKLGTASYATLLVRHNELFESSANQFPGAEIIKHTGDGYFASFPTASDAVRFALVFQSRMCAEPWQPCPISTRLGIHVGEVQPMDMAGRQDVVGLSADIAARLMSLAQGGQILLTSQAFNDARQFVNHAPEAIAGAPPLRWLAHGPYLFKGAEAPLDVYEVGIEGVSPLACPPDSEKARRAVLFNQESTLGWRPAAGLDVPNRPGWTLAEKLGEGGFGEVWLGVQQKLKDRRVFKFCFDAERLRSLKRELTLFRLLREALGDRTDIARLHEVKLDEPPFFLESDYTEGGNLLDWAQRQGGIATLPLDERLQIVAKAADAVAAAHSVGVLHKDIKPSNILMRTVDAGAAQPVLSDFGIGFLADRSRLARHGITEAGFTQYTAENDSSRTGTQMYAPPETLQGKPFTTQGDVFALGVLLYQLAVGELARPLAPGWERDVPDELLREDIAACVEGDPQRRLSGAHELSERLRTLPQRRQALIGAREAARRAHRRRTLLRVVGTAAALLAIVVAGVAVAVVRERNLDAQIQAEFDREASLRDELHKHNAELRNHTAQQLFHQGDSEHPAE